MSVKQVFRKPDKFKINDKVRNNYGTQLTVIKVIYKGDSTLYKCKSSYNTTIVNEDDLSFDWGENNYKPRGSEHLDTCPRCGTPWHTSGFGASIWKDCLKCKRKAEDI